MSPESTGTASTAVADPAPLPITRRERASALLDRFAPWIFLLVFLVVWEIAGRAANPILFAPPSAVASSFVELTSSGELPRALSISMQALLVGMALALVSGLVIGVLLGLYPTLARVVEPYIDAIYATPRVVMIPLVILWFGVGFWGRLFIIWIGGVVPIIFNTAHGVRNARKDLLEVAESFQASRWQQVRHVILPGAVPYVMGGLRIAAGRLLLGVVIAEIFLDLTGVGGIIQTESAYFRTDNMLVGVMVFALLGIVMMVAFDLLEKRFSSWKSEGSA